MSTIKTFVAVDVSSKIQSGAAKLIERLATSGTDYKWVQRGNLHITLNFLGDVDEREVPEVCKLVKSAVEGFSGFDLTVEGLGSFPNTEKPKTVWLGIKDESDQLTELNQQIGEALLALRFPMDQRKDYHPHLTLGRLRRGGRWNQSFIDALKKNAEFHAGACQINDVVVYSSYLDRIGPTYTALSTIPLD